MARIDSYANVTPPVSGGDKLIGTDINDNNATKNFTVSQLIAYVTSTDTYVPYTGATQNVNLGNNNIYGASASFIGLTTTAQINVTNRFYLSGSQGTAGQVLTTQGLGLPAIWSNAGAGPQGIQGPVGPQGPPGPVGPAGLNWQGIWVSGTSYVVDDAVGYGGASWFCINNTSGTVTPDLDATNWALLASQGAQGPIGPTGAQGPTGATGPAGVSGSNTLQQVLDLNHDLIDNNNFQGTLAGNSNTGLSVNAFGGFASDGNSGDNVNSLGYYSASNNTGNQVNAFGYQSASTNVGNDVNALGINSALNNSGNNANALGNSALNGNTGVNANAFGNAAGLNNIYNSVNLFGNGATANGNDQLVLRSQLGYNARISYNSITNQRFYTLPDANGLIALEKYLVYTALLDYNSGSPTATVLQNTLGTTINWTNPSNGIIRGTAAAGSPFTINRTWMIGGSYDNGGQPYFTVCSTTAFANIVNIALYLYDGTITGTPNFSGLQIEIRVYL